VGAGAPPVAALGIIGQVASRLKIKRTASADEQ